MRELYGQSRGALVVLHGGAGAWDTVGERTVARGTDSLRTIARRAMALLDSGRSGMDVVVECLKLLELDPIFNAGLGAALQADGQARLTAALMDGPKRRFSAVISSSYTNHPSLVAQRLQSRSSRVLTQPGCELLAREMGLPVDLSKTQHRIADWVRSSQSGAETGCDTVGALVRTADGRLFAGTSTGGRGFEYPGRVSDSGTVAGTYCTEYAAISATGVGEEIVDEALAARLETRRRDGASLEEASRRCFREAKERQGRYGWIAVDADGHWAIAHNTPAMTFIVLSQTDGEAAASI